VGLADCAILMVDGWRDGQMDGDGDAYSTVYVQYSMVGYKSYIG